jgi:hypothetical protein
MASSEPWHVRCPNRLERVREVAERLQPDLDCMVEDDVVYLRGGFVVYYDGRRWGRFRIEIEFPTPYDRQLATVREMDGRIPWDINRHMYSDGTACLFLEEEFWWRHPDGVAFETFLGDIVGSFFLAQTYFEKVEPRWLFGDRAHFGLGVYHFYAEVFKTEDWRTLHEFLDYIRRGAKGHWKCPCGSGRRLRDCHKSAFSKIRDSVSAELAAKRQSELVKLVEMVRAHAKQEQKS